ncbi:MAG: helix-turn-helix transcriptional regulator, partial [Xanthobacteraceae bacterium]
HSKAACCIYSFLCIYAQMKGKQKTNLVAERLERLLEKRGCTQQELARSLRISQGHLSKLKNGLISPGKRLEKRIDLLNEEVPSPLQPWLESVRRVCLASPDAKMAIDAILRIMHKDA